jgi:Na+-transporting methylmalonyl-CoA/oxaloacetate decarboxylase gamma subunit
MHARGLPALGVFYLSVLGVGVGLLLLLVACVTFSGRVKRSAVWINLCVSCMPSSFL